MAAYMAAKYPHIKVTNIGFGGPKVGNMAFKNWSEQRSNLAVWRYVYDDDAVPRLPPRTVFFQPLGFEHAGHTFQINPGSNCVIYYRHVGNGGAPYLGVPSDWERSCKYNHHRLMDMKLDFLIQKLLSHRPTTQIQMSFTIFINSPTSQSMGP